MNLTLLRAFHAVARSGSFSLAARIDGLSQPTLSAQVKSLEATYGVGLFIRRGRGVELTPAGQSLFAISTRLFAAEEEASALLADLDKLGPADEVTLKRWLAANFKKHGIQADYIKKIVVLPASNTRKTITIIILKNPADEAQAIAVSDEGVPGPKK